MEPVAGDAEAIALAHGVSPACAAAVVALRDAGLAVSAAVLALAADRAPVAALLADPALRAAAPAPTPAALRTLARRHGVAADTGLAVSRAGGRPVLALADELVASARLPASLPPSAGDAAADALTPVTGGPAPPRWREDALRLAAGVEEGERLRALRDLQRAGLPDAVRRGLLLFALRDESHRIRRDALAALRAEGLPTEVADACDDLAAGRPAGRAHALARLAAAADGLAGLPLAVVLLTLGALLRDPDAADRPALLRLCGRLGRAAAEAPRLLGDLLDLLLREAAAGPGEAAAALREGLRGLAAARPPGLAARLLAEAGRLPPGPGRTAVLLACTELPLRAAERAAYDTLLLGPELSRYLEVGEGGVPFRAFLARDGSRWLAPLLTRAETERAERRATLIGLIGTVLRADPPPPPAARRRAAAAFATLIRDAEPGTAVAVLRTGCTADAATPEPARRAVLAAALGVLAQGGSEEFIEEVLAACGAAGAASLPVLVAFASDDLLPRPLRRHALERAARLAEALPAGAATARALRRTLASAGRLARARDFSLHDAMLALQGALAAHRAVPARAREAVARALLRGLGTAPAPAAVGAAEGLAVLAAAAALPPRLVVDAVRALLRLIEAAQAGAVASGPADALTEAPGAALQTRGVPAALAALRALTSWPDTPVVPVAHALRTLWGRVARGEAVLAPGARLGVAEAMVALGGGDRTLRARVAADLLAAWRAGGDRPLVPVLTRALAGPPPLREAATPAAAFVRDLLEGASARDAAQDERQAAVASAATLLAAGCLPPGDAEGLARALLRVARMAGSVDARAVEALAALAAAPGLPRELRREVAAIAGSGPPAPAPIR